MTVLTRPDGPQADDARVSRRTVGAVGGLLFGASKLNLKIVEVPVRYQERIYGSSNIAHVKEGLVLARMCAYAARKLRFIP